jgi:hypothetical protein
LLHLKLFLPETLDHKVDLGVTLLQQIVPILI